MRVFFLYIQPDNFGLKHGNSRVDGTFSTAMPSTRLNAATSAGSIDTTFAALCQAAPAENYSPRNKKFCMNSRFLHQRRLQAADEDAVEEEVASDDDQDEAATDENNTSYEEDIGEIGQVQEKRKEDGACSSLEPSNNVADDDEDAVHCVRADMIEEAGAGGR